MIRAEPPGEKEVSGRWEDIHDRLDRLEARQAELLEDVKVVREQLLVIGGVLEQVRDKRLIGWSRPPTSGPGLLLYRFFELVRSPGEALVFLGELERHAREVSRHTRRAGPSAPWQLAFSYTTYLRRLTGALRELLFGKAAPHYRIVHRGERRLAGRRRKVLHVIPNLNIGGSTQLVIDLIEYLGLENEMQILTAKLPAGGAPVGAIAHLVPLGSRAPAFAHVLDAFAPELVHVQYWGGSDEPWYAEAFAALRGRGLPIIENVNTPVPPLLDPGVNAYAFVSDYVRTHFAAGLDPALAHVIHPGIDRSLFRSVPAARAGDADVADTVVMVYRLERDKLDDASIEVLIEIARQRPATRFLVVGDGPLLDLFVQRTIETGVRANFEFTGSVPFGALPELYGRAGIFIAPVVRESFGQVVPFAMNMGLAVCGNDIGALSEILDGAETLGRDPADTAARALALLNDADRRAALGERNRVRSAIFGVEEMVERYAGLYEQLVPALDMPGFPPAQIFR
ncbi:glycosyltransferase family 4 protein [Ancylobacter sonchi]|uniref:glycosyltransferase family 4 protein n=1 Tax=Ancylobacter sonchi TaxID=1937790 RepID=UPI001BD1FF71|nr:glycosyltransferase family 4 protein [Ancylobacter sonchi]MBS7534433.1 glycosyltransferase family 4 protein [Ancylobacter sonchi]